MLVLDFTIFVPKGGFDMVGPIVGAAARLAAKAVAKKLAKSATKKASSQQRLERTLRSENRGDARIKGRIDSLRKKEEAGLISARERASSLNSMTKSSKSHKAAQKKGQKISGVKRK